MSSSSLICTLLVLAAPAAVHALGAAPALQHAATAANLEQPLSGGPTRGLLTRQLRSRSANPAPAGRSRGATRGKRKSEGRTPHQSSRGSRRGRGPKKAGSKKAGSAKKEGSKGGGSKKKGSSSEGSTKGSRKKGSGSGPPPAKSGGKSKKSDKEIKSESLCAKHVVEKEVIRSKSATAHVSAIEEVFATACLEGSEIDMEVFQEVFMAADAFVFSQTISKAIITCKSDDEDAYECATVTASAKAYAHATADAHAEAVAAAVNACGCMTEAVSESISSESVYIKLIAEAASTATATACIEGKGRVRASAYDKCSSKVYGKVFARVRCSSIACYVLQAVSEAIVKGSCMNAKAISRVLTEASGKFDTASTCGLKADAIAVE